MPIINGGGGGTASPLTTKGDLYGFATVNARIPVGANTTVLTADSTQALGVKWAATGAVGATKPVPLKLTTTDATGNGYAALLSTANIRQVIPAFLKDVVGDWWGLVRIPDNYSSAGAVVISIAANATTGVTTMGLASNPVANAAGYDVALTSESDQDITVPGTAYFRKDVTFTLTPTLAAGSDLNVRIRHNGTAANDTLAVDTLMLAAVFTYTAA